MNEKIIDRNVRAREVIDYLYQLYISEMLETEYFSCIHIDISDLDL